MQKSRKNVLIVDDTEINVEILLNALDEAYSVRVATDGRSALNVVNQSLPDLILLDVVMPGMDGFEVCRRLKENKNTKQIPVIFLTTLSDPCDEGKGLALGAADYISKPFNPELVKARVGNNLELKAHRDSLEEMVKQRTRELERTKEATIASMAILAEYRDNDTGKHIQRTRCYVACLAKELSRTYPDKLTPEAIDLLCQSTPLHDIGKVGIPDAILLKPGKLTDAELSEIKLHTLIGSEAIQKTENFLGTNSFLKQAREIAEFHHERWDGSGYPYGLKENEIPLSARIVAICDIYDALISRRPYKPPFTHEEAVKIITIGDSRTKPEHFSPIILDAFRRIHPEFERIAARFVD
jgi:putative two-component system response regulator